MLPAADSTQMQPQAELGGPEQSYRYTDAEIVRMIDACVSGSATEDNSVLETSRTLTQEHYFGQRPYAADSNTSDFVSLEVLETVESLKAKMIHAFCSNRKIIWFTPQGEDDVEVADAATRFVNKIFYEQNAGFKVLLDLFHDAFIGRLGVVKRWYRERKVSVQRTFEGLDQATLESIAARPEIKSVNVERSQTTDEIVPTPMGSVRSQRTLLLGTIEMLEDRSQVAVTVIPPENVHLSSTSVDLTKPDEIPMVVIEYKVPRYQLIQDGLDPGLVYSLDAVVDSNEGSAQARLIGLQSASGGAPGIDATALDDIQIEEATMWLDLDSDDPGLWSVQKSGAKVISIERIRESPLRFWTPISVAHRAIGLCPGELAVDNQVGSSNVVRGMIDNVHRVNAGVRAANLEQIRNPRDLLDNPIGGVIDTPNPAGAVSVVPQPALSPATGMLIELFESQKEKRIGDMRLGRGVGAGDVVTHQNAADMIDRLIDVGNLRPMLLARSFAEMFLRPLLLDIWHLAIEHNVTMTIEVDGKAQPVEARSLPPYSEMTVDIALLPEQGMKNAKSVLMVHGLIAADPMLAPLYTMEERYKVVAHVCQLIGMMNPLANPTSPKTQQRLQMSAQKQQKMEQMRDAAFQTEIQLKQAEGMARTGKLQSDTKLGKEKLDLEAATKAAAQNLDERQFAWQIETDIAELQLEDKQRRAVAIGDENAPGGS